MMNRKLTLVNLYEPDRCRCGLKYITVFLNILNVDGKYVVDNDLIQQLNKMNIDYHYLDDVNFMDIAQ